MNKLAGHTNTYHTYGFIDALAGISAAGFHYVELSAVPGWTEHVSLDDVGDIESLLRSHGLEAVSLSAHSDLTTREGVGHCLRAIGWAADLGLPIVNTAIGGHAGGEEDEIAFLGNMEELAEAADKAGITIGLEIHGEVMSSGHKAMALMERIGRSSIGVNYDTANVEYYSGRRAVDDLPEVLPHVVSVHLKDKVGGQGAWDFPPLGSGHVDFAKILRILRDSDYSGPLSVELEFQGEPWPGLEQVNQSMRRSYEHLTTLGLF